MAEEKKPDVEIQEEVVLPKGRAAFMERWRGSNPDITDEPDDDTLFDYAGRGFAERDDLKGKYDKLNGANERLAQVISEDPNLAYFIAMISNGENPMFALGKSFGPLLDQLSEENMEELRKGQEEYKANFTRIKNNFEAYEATLKAYAEENQLDEEMVSTINNTVLDLAEAFMDREIPREVIEIIHKGLDYDESKEAELEAAKLAAKNEVIEDIKGKKSPVSAMPDLAGAKSNARKPPVVASKEEDYVPYIDALEVVRKNK